MERYGTIPETAHVVVKIGWEYDDEGYYLPQDGGGVARTVYLSKESADTEAERLNVIARDVAADEEMTTGDGELITEFYEVLEVEIGE